MQIKYDILMKEKKKESNKNLMWEGSQKNEIIIKFFRLLLHISEFKNTNYKVVLKDMYQMILNLLSIRCDHTLAKTSCIIAANSLVLLACSSLHSA